MTGVAEAGAGSGSAGAVARASSGCAVRGGRSCGGAPGVPEGASGGDIRALERAWVSVAAGVSGRCLPAAFGRAHGGGRRKYRDR